MKFGRLLKLAICILSLSVGCARQPGMQEMAPSAANFIANSSAPLFDRRADSSGVSPGTPQRLKEIPSGTLISVKLASSISSATSQAGDTFKAVLAESLLANGQPIAPEGAFLTGAVLAASPFNGEDDLGYVRLALNTITIGGKQRTLQTSGVFVNGGSRSSIRAANSLIEPVTAGSTRAVRSTSALGNVQLAPGRQLTFRLTHLSPEE